MYVRIHGQVELNLFTMLTIKSIKLPNTSLVWSIPAGSGTTTNVRPAARTYQLSSILKNVIKQVKLAAATNDNRYQQWKLKDVPVN